LPKQIKHIPGRGIGAETPILGILELDRFTTQDLHRWEQASKGLNEIWDLLYFGVEPERRKLRHQLLESIKGVGHVSVQLDQWVRIVTYQYSLEPLTSAGSLQALGGRFNAGYELDAGTMRPWPALYLAQNYETAYREKFQLAKDENVDGLTPQELSLEGAVSHTTVFVNGHLSRVFDMTTFTSLTSVAKVLRKIEMPSKVAAIAKKLKFGRNAFFMITTGQQLFSAAVKQNWRVFPAQFGLPAPSQILAELIREAGYEAILYPSSKSSGKCLAVFPANLGDSSFVQLADQAPTEKTTKRLDQSTATMLEGWDAIPRQFR
jgi:hypothetical protein